MREETEDAEGRPRVTTTRRDFFYQIGVGAVVASAVGAGAVTLDFLRPKVLFEPPSSFEAGSALDYGEGTVRFFKEKKAFVIGTSGGIYALSAVCTHLGCIARYRSDEGVIACPCHGSRFALDGEVVHGPAPRPLPWLEVEADAAGNLVVDTSVVVPRGKVLKV